MPIKILKKSAIFALEAQKVLTKLCAYSNNIVLANLKGGYNGNSLLHEVQKKGGDEESTTGYAQERKACNPGRLS
jgi:hypothetical protein